MKTSEKLQFIQKVTGLTQEKLALKLGVSFPTLNSWINSKSQPRKSAEERINELYLTYTGGKTIPKNELEAKKNALKKMSKEYISVLKEITQYPDIRDQFTLSLTYNTNSIEGSTLTEEETAEVLFQNKALANKTLVEQLEAKNHQTAWEFLLRYLESGFQVIDEALILKLHGILMNGIRDDAGLYRRYGVRIVGANIPTANHIKIPDLMQSLITDIGRKEEDVLGHAAKIHSRFEKIHPFSDGNGRIGRLLIHAMLLKKNLPPAVIKQEHKQLYYTYLNKSQRSNDSSLLEDFICDAVFEGFAILKR